MVSGIPGGSRLGCGVRNGIRARTSLPREVLVLGLIAFCVAVGFGVLVPVLPVFARSFGVGNFEVGAVISAFALMRLVSSPLCGRLIERWSERVIMATGIFIVAVSSGLAGISQSYVQLLVLRGVGGIGSAMFTVSAFTLLLTSVDAGLRGRAAGFFQGGFLIGGMAGPAVGALLSAISLTAPFFFYAGTLAVAGTVGLVLLRAREPRPDQADAVAVRFADALRDPRYQAALLTNLAQGWTAFGVRSSLVPVLVVEVLQRPASWTGIAFAVAAVAQTIALGPAGRFVDTVGRRPAMIGGGLAAGVDHDGGAVRPQHLGADRRPVRVRGGLGLPRDRPGGRRGRRDRRGPLGQCGRGLLDVRRPRGHRRAAGGRPAGRLRSPTRPRSPSAPP